MAKTYAIKLGAVLKFDPKKEKDIINFVENLSSKHKLGAFLTNAVRFVYSNPREFQMAYGYIEDDGLTRERQMFFNGINSRVSELENKLNLIYEKVFYTYVLSAMENSIANKDKANNLLICSLILKEQLNGLLNILDVDNSKLEEIEEGIIEKLHNKLDSIAIEALDRYYKITNEVKQEERIDKAIEMIQDDEAESSSGAVNNQKEDFKKLKKYVLTRRKKEGIEENNNSLLEGLNIENKNEEEVTNGTINKDEENTNVISESNLQSDNIVDNKDEEEDSEIAIEFGDNTVKIEDDKFDQLADWDALESFIGG
jgi:hypothetical protein